MFEKMTYHGQPMFGKAIEKYKLALKLLEQGEKPEEIRKKLEYATSYSVNGQKLFDWPPTDVKVEIKSQNKSKLTTSLIEKKQWLQFLLS